MTYLILLIFISNKYSTELQLNKAKTFDTEAPILDIWMA